MLGEVLDWRTKGIPGSGTPITAAEIKAKRWNILRGDMMTPVAVLRQSALDHNRQWMRRFLAATGATFAPHGKTTMSPELFAMQIEDGAWGITAATAGHVRTYRRFGIDRIILANQLVGQADIAFVLDELAAHSTFDFICLADSAAGVRLLEEALIARPIGRPLRLFVELGMAGGRSGCRSDDDALAIARMIAASDHLALCGIEAFEGIVRGGPEGEAAVSDIAARMVALAERCLEEALFAGRPMLSAGGSAFFDIVASGLDVGNRWDVLLRSGCYIVHDSEHYRLLFDRLTARSPLAASLGDGLRPALELWTCVQSRPEPTRIIAGLGKRDTSFDCTMPVPIAWARRGGEGGTMPLPRDHQCVRLDDQHAYLDVPEGAPLQVGDMIGFGISHPCTTFDRWRALYLIDDDFTVTGAIHTCF